jgi:hypothetical protein
VFEQIVQVAQILAAAHEILALHREEKKINHWFEVFESVITHEFCFLLHDVALDTSPIGVTAGEALARHAHSVTPTASEALSSIETTKDDRNPKGGRRAEGPVPSGKRERQGGIATRVEEWVGSIHCVAAASYQVSVLGGCAGKVLLNTYSSM